MIILLVNLSWIPTAFLRKVTSYPVHREQKAELGSLQVDKVCRPMLFQAEPHTPREHANAVQANGYPVSVACPKHRAARWTSYPSRVGLKAMQGWPPACSFLRTTQRWYNSGTCSFVGFATGSRQGSSVPGGIRPYTPPHITSLVTDETPFLSVSFQARSLERKQLSSWWVAMARHKHQYLTFGRNTSVGGSRTCPPVPKGA